MCHCQAQLPLLLSLHDDPTFIAAPATDAPSNLITFQSLRLLRSHYATAVAAIATSVAPDTAVLTAVNPFTFVFVSIPSVTAAVA